MHYDRLTRLFHLFLAFGIALQMIVSLGMTHPKPGRAGDFLFEIHEVLGITLLGVLVTHWLWSMVRPGKVPLAQLIPWFSSTRRTAVWNDARTFGEGLVKLRLPDNSEPSPLAGAIQGLGLIVATILAASGLVIFLYAPENGKMIGWLHDVKEIHEVLGPLMWGYLALHAGAGLLHQLAGHQSITAMFNLWKRVS
ncbi:MAG: cytochrome b/b6 domain-containing protein [Alphaproteobacteria bacterium]|nr:cytochrome b/b6 domain-containing protein [Rhodospirillales bacterium]MCW9046182.1 cytochrome b/b6 domain-containing protein [Alphaproteobacteria bacterium]